MHLTQHVPVPSLLKSGPAKLVSKRSTGCLRGLVEDDSHGIVLRPFNTVGKSLTAGGVPHSETVGKVWPGDHSAQPQHPQNSCSLNPSPCSHQAWLCFGWS